MRPLTASLFVLALCSLLAAAPAAPAAPATSAPASVPAPKVPDLAEELRVLAALNALQPSPEQWKGLAALANTGQEQLTAIEAEARTALERQRDPLRAAREALVRGEAPPPGTDAQVTGAGQAAEAVRAQKAETLVAALSAKLGSLLTPEQIRRIEEELAPAASRPGRGFAAAPTSLPNPARLPSDPARWVQELRDLRTRAVQGDPQRAVDSFARRLAGGARNGTPLFDQSLSQARTLAVQALALPPAAFAQREWPLARQAAKLDLETRNSQRQQDGKPALTFDAPRWLVEQVLLCPRAASVINERSTLAGASN